MSSNNYFCSDLHIGHRNIVRGCSNWSDLNATRDFPTIEEHDAYLLAQLNRFVKPSDTLYILGDLGLGFAWKHRVPELRRQIRCERVHLILGNHDHVFEDKRLSHLHDLFASVKYLKFGKIAGRHMVLCHYAMRTWPWQHHNSIHLYGHSHGNLPDDPNSLSLDVGVDTCLYGHEKYTPYSAEEIFHIMDHYKRFVPVDHHAGSV